MSSGASVSFIQNSHSWLLGKTKIMPALGRSRKTHIRPSSRVLSSAATASRSLTCGAVPVTTGNGELGAGTLPSNSSGGKRGSAQAATTGAPAARAMAGAFA